MKSGGILLSVLLGFSVFLVVGWYYTNTSQNTAIAFYKESLRETASQESVTYDNSVFTVTNGEIESEITLDTSTTFNVLRTAFAKTQSRRSPVYALAGTNLDALQQGMQELSQVQKGLAYIQNSRLEKHAVAHHLYPIQTLKALTDTERARREFLESGATADARTYMRLLKNTARVMEIETERFLRAYKRIVPRDAPTYVTEQHEVTRENSIQTIESLRKRTQANAATVSERSECFNGNIRSCDVHSLQLPSVESTVRVQEYTENSTVESFYNALVSFNSESHLFEREYSPRVMLVESSCLNSEIAPVFDIRKEKKSSGIFEIDDVRMLRTSTFQEIPFFAYFVDAGIEYTPVSPLHHYTCMSLDKDIGAVYATRSTVVLSKNSPLSTYDNSEEIAELEARLRQRVVYEHDARKYIQYGLALATEHQLPTELANTIVDVALQLQNNSAGMEFLVHGVAATERRNMNLWDKKIPVNLESEHLFFSRNGFTSLSMHGNQSFGPRERLFTRIKIAKHDTPYVYVRDMVRDGVSVMEIAEDVYSYSLFHEK